MGGGPATSGLPSWPGAAAVPPSSADNVPCLRPFTCASPSPSCLSPRSRLPGHLPSATLLSISLNGAAWQQCGAAAGADAVPVAAAAGALAGWGHQLLPLEQLLADATSHSSGNSLSE